MMCKRCSCCFWKRLKHSWIVASLLEEAAAETSLRIRLRVFSDTIARLRASNSWVVRSCISVEQLLFSVSKERMSVYVYPYLAEAKVKARELGLPEPFSSQRASKKLFVVYQGEQVHFGYRGSYDYLRCNCDCKRVNFRKRFAKNIGKDDPTSGLFYSWRILW